MLSIFLDRVNKTENYSNRKWEETKQEAWKERSNNKCELNKMAKETEKWFFLFSQKQVVCGIHKNENICMNAWIEEMIISDRFWGLCFSFFSSFRTNEMLNCVACVNIKISTHTQPVGLLIHEGRFILNINFVFASLISKITHETIFCFCFVFVNVYGKLPWNFNHMCLRRAISYCFSRFGFYFLPLKSFNVCFSS